LREFEDALGREWAFSASADFAAYGDVDSPFGVEPSLQLLPAAAVAPANVEQVPQEVRIANKRRLPLFAFSTGRNLGHGGSLPTQPGCGAVDLERMSRALEVNVDQAYVVVEPAVNFMELYQYFVQVTRAWYPLLLQGFPSGGNGR
jgi:4-cresol dehydrogenase (hydroxylating)